MVFEDLLGVFLPVGSALRVTIQCLDQSHHGLPVILALPFLGPELRSEGYSSGMLGLQVRLDIGFHSVGGRDRMPW